MAVKLNELEATGTRWNAPSEDYPQGSFINGTGQGKRDGSYAKAEWANDLFGAHAAILKNGGETPNGKVETANNSQVFNALKKIIKTDIDTLGGDPSAVASGTVNAITATFTKPVSLEGGKQVKVRALGANTSATVTFNPNNLGAKPIVKGDGSALSVGDIASAGFWMTLIYDATLQKWILQNPATGVTLVLPEASTSTKGIIQIASSAEIENGTDVPKAITPKQLKEATKDLGGGLPLGHLFAWPFQTPPDGAIQCNGATYNRSLYKDFFAYATEKGWVKTEAEWQSIARSNGGFCPYYSQGNGSTTFRTPKFAPFMQVAIASGNVGKYHQAGLPNITGTFTEHGNTLEMKCTGAFTGEQRIEIGSNSGGARDGGRVTMNASLSSSIYGASATVQPESHEWMICVVVAGQATNIGSVDVGNVMSAVAQVQAQVGAIPTPSAYITKTWRSGASWYRKWSDGFLEQGGVMPMTIGITNRTISFNASFSSTTDYVVLVQSYQEGSADPQYNNFHVLSKTASGFTGYNGCSENIGNLWYACGY